MANKIGNTDIIIPEENIKMIKIGLKKEESNTKSKAFRLRIKSLFGNKKVLIVLIDIGAGVVILIGVRLLLKITGDYF